MTEPRLIEFPSYQDPTGTLYVADKDYLPFTPKRVFWITELDHIRGNHALKTCEQIIVPVAGTFDVVTFDSNNNERIWKLSLPDQGLYVPPMTWRLMMHFWYDSVAMVLCSHHYDPEDYIQYYTDFLKAIGHEVS